MSRPRAARSVVRRRAGFDEVVKRVKFLSRMFAACRPCSVIMSRSEDEAGVGMAVAAEFEDLDLEGRGCFPWCCLSDVG